MNQFARSDVLYKSASQILKDKTVLIVGLGGVGGICVEALARTGVGNFVLVDADTVEESNINRQLIATMDTIGQRKIDAMKDRILSINPNASVTTYNLFFRDETEIFENVDYVVDAIDTVSSKVGLIKIALDRKIPIISSMGTGNKIDPTMLKVADISKTTVCPLAKACRKALKEQGILSGVKVVFSTEQPRTEVVSSNNGRHSPASAMFVPSAAGLLIAKTVIEDLIKS